jgi:hypothetical protein
MPITYGAEVDSSTAASTTGQATLTAEAGDLLVCCWVMRTGATLVSVADNQLQAWTPATTPILDQARAGIHFVVNALAGSTTVTVTAGSSDTIIVKLSRWPGAATSSVLDQFNSNLNAGGTTHSHGSITTSASCGLIITVAGQSATVADETVSSGFTALALTAGNNRQWWQYRITDVANMTTTASYTSVTSHSSGGMIASFLDAVAATGQPAIRRVGRAPMGMQGVRIY